MRILLDVDGVLADWHGHLVNRINDAFGSSVRPEDITEFYCVEQLTILALATANKSLGSDSDEILAAVEWAAYESDYFYATLPVIPGTQEAVARARRLGHQVFFVTSPISTMPTWAFTRTEWLKKHFEAKDEEIVITKSKHVVYGDVLVDDKPKNVLKWVESWRDTSSRGFLLKKPYNKDGWDCDLYRKIDSLSEII